VTKLSERDHFYAHPSAIAQAKALEAHGYGEVTPTDLADQDDVMCVSHADGTVAPARYHRLGDDVDHLGNRSQHIFEAYPGSEYSDCLPYAKTMRTTPEGEAVSRMAIFRPSKEEHALHGPLLYDARERMSQR
jgi:hypothetical protein